MGDKPLCHSADIPVNVFFPDEDHLGQVAYAKSICNVCKISEFCLDAAMKRKEEYGIWGGLTPKERSRLSFRVALNAHSLPTNGEHELEHPKNAYLSSPSHISDEENHIQPVSQKDFAQSLASRIGHIELSMLQSPEEFPSGPNQKSLVERVLVEYKNFRQSRNLHPESSEATLTQLNHDLSQIPEPLESDLIQLELDPSLFDVLDQYRVRS